MYEIMKASVRAGIDTTHSDTHSASPDPDPADPWLFTDPVARSVYARRGRLRELKRDIRTYVMYQGRWAADELALKSEIRSMLQLGILEPKPAFGYLSPHPTVYKANDEGVIVISGRRFWFEYGDEVVFVPWLARVSHPALTGPIRVGALREVNCHCLCREAYPTISKLCEKGLAVLRQTLRS
ncbi:MAG: hypothetical protein A2W36_01515 [Chloroflexi bacterium RBG_16_58_14]|nr:MAG: hypothetical protein A2W36_01515 [Chloroflexi bacterium RBG_16_58_14]